MDLSDLRYWISSENFHIIKSQVTESSCFFSSQVSISHNHVTGDMETRCKISPHDSIYFYEGNNGRETNLTI